MALGSESRESLVLLVARVFVVIGLIPNGLRKVATFDITSAMMGGAPPVVINGRLFPEQEPLFYFPSPEFFLGASGRWGIDGWLGHRREVRATS